MTRLNWTTSRTVNLGPWSIPTMGELPGQQYGFSGIKPNSKVMLALKKLAWPLRKLRDDLLVDGFIEREVERLFRKYYRQGDTCLEIGCGDLEMSRVVDGDWYNALDIRISEFHLRRMLERNKRLNVVLASASDIPAGDATVDVVISTETFTFIPDIDGALKEIRRVMKTGGRLMCSIPNNFSHLYVRKGPNRDTLHEWSFDGFAGLMEDKGFRLLERSRAGWWVPTPKWLTDTAYTLPFTPRDEYRTTTFFYAFEAVDG